MKTLSPADMFEAITTNGELNPIKLSRILCQIIAELSAKELDEELQK